MPTPPPLALAYHGVSDVPPREDPHGLFVRPRDLRRHIATLRRWGYELVTFGELAARAARGAHAGACALTFDDGFSDNLHALVPLLEQEGAPATVFVVSGWLGRPHPDAPSARIVTEAELRDLAARGIEIGGHTATHPDLTTLTAEAAREELATGRAALEAITGRAVDVLAYPYGRATPEVAAAAAAAGFRAACRTSGNGAWDRPLDLPRQDVGNRTTMLGLRLRRDGRYEPLVRHLPARAVRRAAHAVKGLGR